MSVRKIKIPEKLYIGLSEPIYTCSYNIPFGYTSMYNDDSENLKRMSSIDIKSDPDFKRTIIENIPLTGFKLTEDIKSGRHGGGSDYWLIEDPRGFSLHIRDKNFAKLLSECTIHNGEILDPCIWGKYNGIDYLLSTNGKDYEQAIKYNEIASKKESIRKVLPGYKITLQNGDTGIYLGKTSTVNTLKYPGQLHLFENFIKITPIRHTILLDRCTKSWYSDIKTKTLKFTNNIKISSFEKTAELTNSEIDEILNNEINNKKTYIDTNFSIGNNVIFSSTSNITNFKISIEEQASNINISSFDNNIMNIVQDKNGHIGILTNPLLHFGYLELTCLNKNKLLNDKIIELKLTSNSRNTIIRCLPNDIDKIYYAYVTLINPTDCQEHKIQI